MTSTATSDEQALQAYFSHSYRAEERPVNLFFWHLFSANGFFFTVDPKSERLFVPYLEWLMRASDCFIAVVTRRVVQEENLKNVAPLTQHSPYIEFENRLSIRSGKPRLVFVENGLEAGLFGAPNEVHVFDRDTLDKRANLYSRWVQDFAKAVRDYKLYSDRQIMFTRKAGVMLAENSEVYSPKVMKLIEDVLRGGGFTATPIPAHIADDQLLVRQLSEVDLIVTETREPFVTSAAQAFAHAKFVPAIRLSAHQKGESQQLFELPEIITYGYAIGDIEPIVNWQTEDDLVSELLRYMRKFQQARTLLGNYEAGKKYFMRAGRRDARVFISNAHTLNDVALALVNSLKAVSIQCFHYMDSMRIGASWKGELDRELENFDLFIALIDKEYHFSHWCQYELEFAFKRWQKKDVTILPYVLSNTPLPELIKDDIQCAVLPSMSLEIIATIVDTVDMRLIEMEQVRQAPTAVRDRAFDLDRALDQIAAPNSEQLTAVARVIDVLSRSLRIRFQEPSMFQAGICIVDAEVSTPFIELRGFPSSVSFVFLRSPILGQIEIDAFKSLILGRSKPMLLVVAPISESSIDNAQRIVDHRICQPYACDLVIIGHETLRAILVNPDPNAKLKACILRKSNLLNYSPFVINGPVPSNVFFGRESEIRTICDNARATSYAVIGGRRVGKSSLLRRLQRTSFPRKGYRALYHDCEATSTYDDFCETIISGWQPDAPLGSYNNLGDVLAFPPQDKPLVILLDEVDKLLPYDRVVGWKLFKRLRALSNSGNMQFVLGGERSLREVLKDPSSPLFNFANEIILGPLSLPAVYELVTQPMRQLEIEFEDETQVVQWIYDFTSGHPNVVQRLCARLIAQLIELDTRTIDPEQVSTIIRDPGFLRNDFLTTYWEAATGLEKIITLIMVDSESLHSADAIRRLLAERYKLQPKAGELDGALQRLVDLRSILSNTPDGYEFAAKAFPRAISKTITLEDMLGDLVREYQEKG